MKQKILPILIGGLVFGVISGIPFVGWLWFVWAILGGMLAILLYRKWSKVETATTGEAVWVGVGAGVVGAVAMFVLAMIMTFLMWMLVMWNGRPNMTLGKAFGNTLEFMIEKDAARTVMQIVMSAVCAVLSIGFAALGGFLGKLLIYRTAAAPQTIAPNLGGASTINS